MKRVLIALALAVGMTISAQAQKDHVKYISKQLSGIIEEIRGESNQAQALDDSVTSAIRDKRAARERLERENARELRFDISQVARPASPDVFKQEFHFPPLGQFRTGTCWCFSTTSFLETEIFRQTGRKVKLSEMYTVYFEFVEKARHFVRERADDWNGQGSESNAVMRIMKLYGAVPAEAYSGSPSGRRFDHTALENDINAYLHFAADNGFWHEDEITGSVKLILDKYMGRPPESFTFEGRTMTPREFAADIVKVNLDDFVSCMSTSSVPFYAQAKFDVADNWNQDSSYYNLPLEEWYAAIKNAIKNGYTVAIGGDVSEGGYIGAEDIAIVPDFDVPQGYINQDSREYRLWYESTTDDHGVHLVGYTRLDGHDWFLAKDSSRRLIQGKFEGYVFYRDDYVRLKMMTLMVHKDALKGVLRLAQK